MTKFDVNKIPVFICIGTTLSKADSIAPRIGSILSNLGYEVIGTIEEPLHALNMEERSKTEIERFRAMSNKYQLIAIDCYRFKDRSTEWDYLDKPIVPRASVDNTLTHIHLGDISVGVNSLALSPINDKTYKFAPTWDVVLSCEYVEESKYTALAARVADDIINKLNGGM